MSDSHEWPDGVETWVWDPTDEPQTLICSICERRIRKGEVVVRPHLSRWAHKACRGGAA